MLLAMRWREFRVVVLVALCAAPLQAQLTESQRQAIDKICKRFDRDSVPGISIAVTQKGKQVFAKAYGSAQLEHNAPNRTTTIFHVASVTKQFTAFALVLLAQDKKLSLDDDVRKHVPWLHDFGKTITIRHLLNHTSGLRDQWELLVLSGYRLDDVLTKDHILRILRHQKELNFAPGSRYLYSNMGFTLAAHVVAKVADQPFESFCQDRIFEPLGMTRTHMHVDHLQIVPGRAYSYRRRDLGWQKGVLSYANAGATSLFTTAEDLAKWQRNFVNPKLGGKAAIDAMQTRGELTNGTKIDYALGLMHGTHGGRPTIGHGGADAGFRSDVVWFPKEQLGIVALANVSDANPGSVTRRIADVLLGAKARPANRRPPNGDPQPNRAEIAKVNLADFVGRYYCPELEAYYTIVNDGGVLRAEHRRHGEMLLQVSGKDTLTGRAFYFRTLRFQRKAGEITGFRLDGSRVLNLKFVRTN